MIKSYKTSPTEVDFWLDSDKYANFLEERIDSSNKGLVFNIDMVRLSSIRKAISNFVRILTRKSIPVYFNDANANVNFGGKVIYISAKINTKHDFDVAIGQALHEGAHTLKTDFDVVKIAWANIPHEILRVSDSKNIRRTSLEKFIHTIWNVIEDRFIDNYVFTEAPGYRGYYVALYNKFWNCPEIDAMLQDPDLFRYPSLESYSFRIINFTNLNTDLLALPRLDEIAKIIDISHIDRLNTTKKRIETAFEVVEVVLDCLDKLPVSKTISCPPQKLASPQDYFDFGDNDDENTDEKSDGGESEEGDVGKNMIEEISDVISGKDSSPDSLEENQSVVNKITLDDNISKEIQKQIKNTIESQRKFLRGELPKDQLTEKQKSLMDLIEKHGITLVQVKIPNILPGDDKNLKVDCIVVQKMTKELILAGENIFPLSAATKIGNTIPEPPEKNIDAVKKGIQLGIKLGRKLQIRSEINPVKIVRKKWGKINKRQIHEAAFDAEDLFYKIKIDEHKKANLHITVDSSGSMSAGNKWHQTMMTVVAICKAASMVDNVHVTVSFRSTQTSGNLTLPYIIMAYDSNIDKFSKIKNLFPYLCPNGLTPEGLAFGATMNLFESITPDEEERYFLNLSDGEPYYFLSNEHGINISYSGETGSNHTKTQVDKIRNHGVEILSYFIEDSGYKNDLLQNMFRKMYGKDARFINVENIVELAKTINELFLKKKT